MAKKILATNFPLFRYSGDYQRITKEVKDFIFDIFKIVS